MKKTLRNIFKKFVRSLSSGHNLSRFKIVRYIYDAIFSLIRDTDSIANVHGFKMQVDERDSLRLSVWGVYEEFETEIVKKYIKRGYNVIDIGANIGYYTLLFSRLVGEEGRVVAFEPDPTNFSILKNNVWSNKISNTILEQKALSDVPGKIKLYLNEANKGDHRIYDSGDDRKSIEVEATQLDQYLDRAKIHRIDFIKMDIQGAELRALRGMKRVLGQNNLKIITEFWPSALKSSGSDPLEMLDFIQRQGFVLLELNEPDKKLEPIKDFRKFLEQERFRTGDANILCIK